MSDLTLFSPGLGVSRGTAVFPASRDPRVEKLRDFRHLGRCRRARCGCCHPDKRWHATRRRTITTE